LLFELGKMNLLPLTLALMFFALYNVEFWGG